MHNIIRPLNRTASLGNLSQHHSYWRTRSLNRDPSTMFTRDTTTHQLLKHCTPRAGHMHQIPEVGHGRLTRVTNRSAQRIPSDWAPLAHRDQPYAEAVPNAHLCTKHRCCKVKILVLSHEIAEGQEGEWRDR